jgi:hypothetical protein
VIESKQYERLLRTNPAFRQARMRKECGPITDPQLHQSRIASFEQYASHRCRRGVTRVAPDGESLEN